MIGMHTFGASAPLKDLQQEVRLHPRGDRRGLPPSSSSCMAAWDGRDGAMTGGAMQLGMVGLGRMGANLVRRLMRDGHECVVYDVNAEAVKALEQEGATRRRLARRPRRASCDSPASAWVMVPAAFAGDTLDELAARMERGRHRHRRRQQLLPRRHRPRRGARAARHPLRRRRHERRRLRARARLLPDDRRRAEPVERLDPIFRDARPRRRGGAAHARPRRRARPRPSTAICTAGRPAPATS